MSDDVKSVGELWTHSVFVICPHCGSHETGFDGGVRHPEYTHHKFTCSKCGGKYTVDESADVEMY